MSSLEGQVVGWMHVNPIVAPAEAPSLTEADAGEAVSALVAQYSTTLYRVAYSITRNSAEAEDAVQETFLRVLRHREKLGEIRDHRVWLVRITWNVVLDRKRRAEGEAGNRRYRRPRAHPPGKVADRRKERNLFAGTCPHYGADRYPAEERA